MLAVISHDAGGAEILSSWLRQNPQPSCLVIEGPAKAIFQRKIGNFEIHTLDYAIETCDWILCGTSWQSELEKRAIIKAKSADKKIVAFLDHWTNYSSRFELNGITTLPDELWVGDLEAKKIAQSTFPETPVKFVPNPYFEDLKIELKSFQILHSNYEQNSILYICEPIREHALLAYGNERHLGYTEEDALIFFLKNLHIFEFDIKKIKIRPHPSESKTKYEWVRAAHCLVKETFSPDSIMQQILEADVVVGCESMGLEIALLARKRVISSIPPGGRPCSLKSKNIEHLQELVKKYQETLR